MSIKAADLDGDALRTACKTLNSHPDPKVQDVARWLSVSATRAKERADARAAGCSVKYLRWAEDN